MMIKKLTPLWLLLLAVVLQPVSVMAMDKPFVENKVVLQISDGDPAKQTLVLNVANNLIKEYGADKVDVQVVAFGPGIGLLLADNANGDRIKSLSQGAGVEFHACSNTLKGLAKKTGKEPVVNPLASKSSPGIVRIVKLTNEGYLLVRP